MNLTLYSICLALLTPAILLLTLLEAYRRKGGVRYVKERFGLIPRGTDKVQHKIGLWFHAASLGEVNIALPLITQFQSEGVLLTCTTPEAMRLAEARLGSSVTLRYFPLDFIHGIRRFLTTFQPQQLYVIETEIWPRLFHECAIQQIPIALINGRLSDKTMRAPGFAKALYARALAGVDTIWAREAVDYARFVELGYSPARLSCVGDSKLAGKGVLGVTASPLARPYCLAISTHEGEERAVVSAWRAAGKKDVLVIIPRHPARAEDILRELTAEGLRCCKRTDCPDPSADTEIYLADTVGEVDMFCAHATFVFVGGSLFGVGGHNVMEPARLGKAIITGADTANFDTQVRYLREHGAIKQADTLEEFPSIWRQLTDDAQGRHALEVAAQHAFDALPNMSNIYVEHIRARLAERAPAPAKGFP